MPRFSDARVLDADRTAAVTVYSGPGSDSMCSCVLVLVFICLLFVWLTAAKSSRVSSNPSRPGFTTDREQHFSQDPYDKRVEDVGPPEYPFIDSQFLSSLPPEDVVFLFSKGCRTLPDEDAIDEFARQYFKRLHPSVPVVDEVEFWRIVYQQDGCSGKISLFVFQAILFAGCPVSHVLTREWHPSYQFSLFH